MKNVVIEVLIESDWNLKGEKEQCGPVAGKRY